MSELIAPEKKWEVLEFGGSQVSGTLSDEAKQRLRNGCQSVFEQSIKAKHDMCLLGYELKKLYDSELWKYAIDPETGQRFLYSSFEAFARQMFNFSETHTWNLKSLAQFVEEYPDGSKQVKLEYQGYSISALTELGTLEEYERVYFTPNMPIKEIRKGKKFVKSDSFRQRRKIEGFDFRAEIKRWDELFGAKKQIAEPLQSPTSETKSDEVYIKNEFSEIEKIENDVDFAREFAEEETRETFGQADDYEPETFWQGGGLDDVDEPAPAEVYAHELTSVSDACLMPNSKSYELTARDKVRKFLKDYKNWTKIDKENLAPGVINEYEYIFESEKVALIAREVRWFKDMESKVEKVVVRFYWDTLYGDGYIEASKAKLEKFIPAHLDELKFGGNGQ